MNAPRLRGLTTPLTANSLVLVQLPDGTIVEVTGHRVEVFTSADKTSKTTHLILTTEEE